MRKPQVDPEEIAHRLSSQSAMILAALDPVKALPATQIMDRIEGNYAQAGFSGKTMEPSTFTVAMRRMQDDGLVRRSGTEEVDVPGPRGSTYRAMRDVFVITGLGMRVLRTKARLDAVISVRVLALP